MFSGIVEGCGSIEEVKKSSSGIRLVIRNEELFSREHLGSSIAVNGVCLTQSDWQPGLSSFDIVTETIRKTTLGSLKEGNRVNLERSLKAGVRIDGHFVQGHVDGIGRILKIDFDLHEYWFEVPDSLCPYLLKKASIVLDGVSLTIAEIKESLIRVALVPHTLLITNLKSKQLGDLINIEVDLFAKYIRKYLGEVKPETLFHHDV